jgi:hypothetical protein
LKSASIGSLRYRTVRRKAAESLVGPTVEEYYRQVPSCCRSALCEEMFTAKDARKTLRRYRKKGLNKLERQMVASVPPNALRGARVLEIGGGIGTIQAELLARGAESGEIGIEARFVSRTFSRVPTPLGLLTWLSSIGSCAVRPTACDSPARRLDSPIACSFCVIPAIGFSYESALA